MSFPDSGRFSYLESVNGITLGNGVINISPDEMSSIDDVIIGTALPNKVLIPNEDSSISGLNSLFIEENFFTAFATIDDILLDGATIGHTDDTDLVTLSNGTVTVAGTVAATTLTGDGSGITGVSASSLKSDDITEGDAAVTISTSTGAINLTPATGSAVVLDGSVNVDGGAVTGATTITASGAITGGSVTDGTATMSSGALSGVTTITGSGLATVGSLDVDDVLVDGATIGHTDDTDLVTLSNGTVTVAGTVAATTLTGDGSGITGVSANSIKSDDITEGDAAVTISTSTGAINLTPATGSAVVLDGSVNVDGGAVTGATTITASGAITGGSVTDGTATMSSGALSGVTTITGSGLATVGSLDVDDVLVDGATIGHTDDTDLVTLSNGTVTVAGTVAATTLTGDGSGITGVSANSIKSDDITEGDAAVTISTSTGAINLTPATGSAVVLDGSVNVDGGAVTGATTITASGAITGGSVTDGTATMSSGALSGVTTITGSGLATVGSLDVDDVLVDGATIGHTDDTDLVTLSNGTVTVAGTLAATTLTGDGSGITGVSANSIKSDDITEGDAAVTISTSTGAINLTPATGSAVVLDGSVNVDGGAVTGATTITASGAITGGSVTDGTATMSSGALSGVTTITGSGLATVGSLDVDDVLVDGATIGHTDDTDLVTLSNGTVTVAGTVAATTLTGDGSGITGVSANSIKSDDITEGDAAVTISTSTGAINLTPATGSAVVLDGSVNVDGGAVTGATTITASGAITGGSVTDGTATMSSGALSGVTTITGSGLATVGSLDVDDVLVDGATIGHTDDTDLVTLSNGTVTVAGTLAATTLTGDGSGITGVSANSIKSDDITEGDAAVTISTSTGAINLTPATGSAVVLDGSVNVDGGAVTGATTITASGAITGGSVTDGTATMSSGALSGVTTITGSGLATVGSLDVDDVLVDGATIGHTDDTDLVTLSNGTVTVAGTVAATTLTGDGSGITGVSANSIKSDDITEGDAAVTISTSTGAINLTPATGSAVVLDGSVNVDGGAVTGATTITASGAITGGSVTDGTATMSSGALSGVTTITGSGLATVGSLDVDDVLVDGATIGHTDDTDLVTLSNGTVTVAGTVAATTLTGDGSGITGVSANSIKSDDITEGDAAVTISTSTGAINLTPATGSAVVLDGSVNVDGGAVTGATTITASGAITGGSVTDGTATMSSGALSGVTTITGSGLATVGSLDVDDVLVDGATIGHTDDTDLVTLSNGTVTVAGTLAATTLTGDGSGITGVSASSLKSDDITEGDAAVTISTSTGAINLTPATGSAVVLDGSVNVDGGAVTGATTITASGAITGGSVTDGTATMSSGALSGVTTITGSGLATVGSLDVDDVLVDGATIGHTDDTDLVTLSNGTVTVAGTVAATTLTGDGSGITGVSANSIKSDDITEGDAAVTISTSTGAINLTPATGSAVVLDGSVNVDGGAVTGATTITASGAITGGSVTDGTATMSSGALSGVTTITGSGLATVGSLDVDDVLVDGATIGHTDDTDLVTLSNGTVTVAGTVAATTLTGDGSGITGVSANSIKSDDITEGDAAVTISTSTGAINLTPATGSAVVLDGSVNVDGGAVTGATTITASGAITGGSVTDGTATMSSGALSGVTTITGSGLATVGSLDVDDVLVDGATIGHTDDTDLVTLSNGTVTVAGTLAATTLTGDGSGITGVSASSLKSDDITEGDAAVTISTSTGAINLTPATGSAVVLDGSVNVDGGAVTGATTITASGAITGGSVTDGTATMSSGALSGVTTITGSGLATVGSLDVDDVLVDGATIGHTDDTDLVTLSNGTVTVAGTVAATTLTGDGSGITGVSANSIKSDDITEGDAAVTISTSTGAINLTPATGSAVVLDGSVNVDGGAVTGATTITASGAITGGSVTDGTATMSSGALSGVTTITGSGLATVGSLDVDDVLVDGATIGHTDDTDLVTLSNGTVTVAGEITATTLDIGGTNITATATEINVLDGALKENNSIWIGNDPSHLQQTMLLEI